MTGAAVRKHNLEFGAARERLRIDNAVRRRRFDDPGPAGRNGNAIA